MNSRRSTFLLPPVTATVSLREGMRLSAGGIDFVLWEMTGSEVVLKREMAEEYMLTSEYELITAIQSREVLREELPGRGHLLAEGVSALRDSEARKASEIAIQVALDKARWLDALQRRGVDRVVDKPWVRTIMLDLAKHELKDAKPFAISTLYAAQLALQKADGDITALVPDNLARGGPGKSRMDPRAQAIAADTIRAILAREGTIKKRAVATEIAEVIRSQNTGSPSELIKVPSESTLTRFVAAHVPAFNIVKSKRGSRAAKVEFRQNAYARDVATRPLEKSEWDDVDSGIFCISQKTGLPWGRAYMTNGIDQCSKVVLGFDLGGHARSYESMMGAICHSLLPKPDGDDGMRWDGYGCQGAMLLDNARYNFCEAAKKQSASARLLLSGARPRGPTEKSTIENYNGTVQDEFCRTLPGWVGEEGDRDALKEGASSAILPVELLRKLYVEWVCKQYMNKPSSVTGLTPRDVWRSHYRHFGPAVRYSADQLALLLLIPKALKFRNSGGLLRLGIRYTSDELYALEKRMGSQTQVNCYVNRRDMSYLVVENPFTRETFRVGASEDPHYVRGLTEYQQRLINAKAKELGWNNPSLREYVLARRALEEQVYKAMRSSAMRRRRWAEAVMAFGANAHLTPGTDRAPDAPATEQKKPKVQERVVTELESQMMELEEYLRHQVDEEMQ